MAAIKSGIASDSPDPGSIVSTSILYKSLTIAPVANGTSIELNLDPEIRLHRAVGIWRTFDTEKFRVTPSYVAFNMILPFPTASVVRLVPKPCTTNGDSNEV
ncbi:hypothetical protein C8R43DRAFT_893391 [Mycena crocata]|nr:hypothetical protein C8R43DRAFT_893391 [Mycena crocata]